MELIPWRIFNTSHHEGCSVGETPEFWHGVASLILTLVTFLVRLIRCFSDCISKTKFMFRLSDCFCRRCWNLPNPMLEYHLLWKKIVLHEFWAKNSINLWSLKGHTTIVGLLNVYSLKIRKFILDLKSSQKLEQCTTKVNNLYPLHVWIRKLLLSFGVESTIDNHVVIVGCVCIALSWITFPYQTKYWQSFRIESPKLP